MKKRDLVQTHVAMVNDCQVPEYGAAARLCKIKGTIEVRSCQRADIVLIACLLLENGEHTTWKNPISDS